MSEWQPGILADIAVVKMGQSPKGESCNPDGQGQPLLNGPTEFGTKFPLPVQYTTEITKKCSTGDILFCVRGSTTGRMNWANREYVIGRGIAALTHKAGEHYRSFLRGLVEFNLDYLLASATGSTFPNVSRDLLENLEILVPPLPEQRAIASVLSSLDDKIDLLHRQNKTLESMAETLFRQWFVEPFDSAQGGKAEENRTTILGVYAVNIRQNARIEDLGNFNHYVGLEHIPRKCITLSNWGSPAELESNKSVFQKKRYSIWEASFIFS